ncbi:MAG: hypothetical protein IJP38_07035 [Oscillospiraceae bacterium]|nr:hypothetical protein [Clostridia bacterium]MBQ9986048.1 hypothetical protein [Oscillospiraceae bacterium]
MDIGRLKNNREFCAWWPEPDIILSLKESPEYNLYIWEGYIGEIFEDPIFTDKNWVGFTRDYHEWVGAWEDVTEIENVDEYIWDMLRYKDKEYDPIWKNTVPKVFDLIIDFLTYAKQTGQTVIMEEN